MNHDDRIEAIETTSAPSGVGSHGSQSDFNAAGGIGRETRSLVPVLVEQEGAEFGLVWLTASRSELVPGALFAARGRRFLVTGRSPSGATYVCRDVTDELPR